MTDYHLIGEEFEENNRPQVFELRILDHLVDIDPESYKISGIASINPTTYFITSGDALEKAIRLEKDLWALAGKLRSEAPDKTTKKYDNYVSAVWTCAGKCRSLVNKLRIAKGENCFLETEWTSESVLLCLAKNPRKRD